MKKAYVFPGQGSQFPGMAKDLYESGAKGKELLDRADEVLGFKITDIMFNGTADDLKATKVTQPAIFLHSVVLAKCYEGFAPDMVAGHSLGEFSALAAAGAKRALPLQVGGAFHSPLMEPARVELGKAIERTEIVAPVCPIYQNVTAAPTTDPDLIKENLLKQLTSPVRWTATVENMLADGAGYFMEIGPGTVLQGLVKRISGGTEGIVIEGLSSL